MQELTTIEFLNYLNSNYSRYVKKAIFGFSNIDTPGICHIHSHLMGEFIELLVVDQKGNLAQLLDLFAVDYPFKKNRFEINYVFLSLKNIFRVIFKLTVLKDWSVFSLTKFYKSANWLEREIWDMFGVFFYDHPDLRRILTDYGFDGYPLRKDFPITGFKEVRYDDERKKIVLEPIRMTQEFRYFDFTTPWN